ncbi:hypothetical protein NQ314_005794, partial [Rhamnusium bicolor]
LWFRGVRSSKFRHVYGEPAKREKCYDNIQITKNAHDSQFCAVNPKFIAIVTEVAGGGAFIVIPINCTGRLDFNANRVTGHSGPILDIKWNPFNDNVIASCSDDCTIKLWHIPDEGLSMHLTDWLVELQGHKRRVAYIEWHPTAENILFSAGFDHLVIVWDIEKGEAVNVIDCHHDAIHSMSLNRDGSLLATTCKDKKIKSNRTQKWNSKIGKSVRTNAEGMCHAGSKASKVVFLGTTGRLLTTGFSRHSDRQYSVWDENDISKPLYTDTIDSSSGIVFPFYDIDTNIVFLAGKGDGNIRYYEITDEAPYVHFLNQFLSGNPQRGLGFMPKRGLKTSQCEVFRFYKLHATKGEHNNTLNITSIKQRHFKVQDPPAIDNNKRKFAFLSTETIPDYRPKDLIIEKSQKTSNNQTTKFQQLQQRFSHVEVNNKDIPLIKEINSLGDNILTEHDLRRAYQSQSEEIRKLKKHLANSEQRVRELEEQVRKLTK